MLSCFISVGGYVKIPHLRDGTVKISVLPLQYQSIGEIILITD